MDLWIYLPTCSNSMDDKQRDNKNKVKINKIDAVVRSLKKSLYWMPKPVKNDKPFLLRSMGDLPSILILLMSNPSSGAQKGLLNICRIEIHHIIFCGVNLIFKNFKILSLLQSFFNKLHNCILQYLNSVETIRTKNFWFLRASRYPPQISRKYIFLTLLLNSDLYFPNYV